MSCYFSNHRGAAPTWRLDDDESLWHMSDNGQWLEQSPVKGGNRAFIKDMLKRCRLVEIRPDPPAYTMATTTGDAW